MKRVGLFGGSFNPIHLGHLILAETARVQYDLDWVVFIPNHLPPHRHPNQADWASDEDRFQMCSLAVEGNPFFQVSRIELERPGVSYTYDTVAQLKGKNQDTSYFFICGSDALTKYRWYRFEDLLEILESFLVACRGLEGKEGLFAKVKSEYPQFLQKIRDVQMPQVEISSTLIRQKIQKKESIRYLVPDGVVEYIETHQLYRRSQHEYT
jgi:nicotinate-nucleotide adenylyltransferase